MLWWLGYFVVILGYFVVVGVLLLVSADVPNNVVAVAVLGGV